MSLPLLSHRSDVSHMWNDVHSLIRRVKLPAFSMSTLGAYRLRFRCSGESAEAFSAIRWPCPAASRRLDFSLSVAGCERVGSERSEFQIGRAVLFSR